MKRSIQFNFYAVSFILLAGLTLAIMGVGLKLPIYSDEIVYRLIGARYFEQGPRWGMVYPQCFPPGFELPESLLFMPFLAVISLFYRYFEAPGVIRLVSMGFYLLNLVLWSLIVRKSLSSISRTHAWSLALASWSFGVVPYLLMLNRPEQITLTAILVGFYSLQVHFSRMSWGAWLLLLGFAYTGSHYTLFFTPFFLSLFWLSSARIPVFQWGGSALVLLFALESYLQISLAGSCPQSPVLNQLLKRYTLNPSILWSQPYLFMKQFFWNLYSSFASDSLLFSDHYPSVWLPQHPMNLLHGFLNSWISFFYLGVVGFAVLGLLQKIWKDRDWIRSPRGGLILVLFFCTILMAGLCHLKNFYAWALYVPLFSILCMSSGLGSKILMHPLISKFIIGFSLFSIGVGGWTLGQYHQPTETTIPNLDETTYVSNMDYLKKTCFGSVNLQFKNLVIDDFTYWGFRKNVEKPFHHFYVNHSQYAKLSISDFHLFTREFGIEGGVVHCRELVNVSKMDSLVKVGPYCCWRNQ